MPDDTNPDGKGGAPLDAFDELDLAPTKPLPVLSSLKFSASGSLLHVTFTNQDGSQGDFQFNSSEIFSLAKGDSARVADVLVTDYSFSPALSAKLLGEISESPEFKAHAATLQQQVQDATRETQDAGHGTQNAGRSAGPQNTEPSLGGTHSEAQLGAMLRPPGAAHLAGDFGISDPARLVDINAVTRGSGKDESSTFLVQPPDRQGGIPLRPVPPPTPGARRGRRDETVVVPDSGDAGTGHDETIVLEGDDIRMESGPAEPITGPIVTGGAAASVEEQVTEIFEDPGEPILSPSRERGEIALVSDVPPERVPTPPKDVSRLNEQLLGAAAANDVVVAKAALANGADPNGTDKFGVTPLMLAARNHSVDVFHLLRNTPGVDRTLRDDNGDDALAYARKWSSDDLVSEFQRWAREDFEKPRTGSAALPFIVDEPRVVSVPGMEDPTVQIKTGGEPLNPEGRPEGEEGVTRQLPADLQPAPVTPALVFPPRDEDRSAQVDEEPVAQPKAAAPVQPAPEAAPQPDTTSTSSVPVVSIGYRGHALVLLGGGSEVILTSASIFRVLAANRTHGRDGAARVLGSECPGIQADLSGRILDVVCDPNFIKHARELVPARAATSVPAQPTQAQAIPAAPAQTQSATAAAQSASAQAPVPRAPTREELNAQYLFTAANGDVDGIKIAIAQGANREARTPSTPENPEKKTALMLAAGNLHLAAVRCLIEEIKVDPHGKGEMNLTVFSMLPGLGDSSEAQAVRSYLNGILEKERQASAARQAAQDAVTMRVHVPKSRSSHMSNLPWGWMIGAGVVVVVSVLFAGVDSFRRSVVDFPGKVRSAARVLFTGGVVATKDGDLHFTGFSSKSNWWKEGKYNLQEADAVTVADFMRLGLYEDAKKMLMQKFGVSDSMAGDMLNHFDSSFASRFLKKPVLLRPFSTDQFFRFCDVQVNGIFVDYAVSRDVMWAVVRVFVTHGREAAVGALQGEFSRLGINPPESALGDMIDTITFSAVGKQLVEAQRLKLQEMAEEKKRSDAAAEAALASIQDAGRITMEAKDAALIQAAQETAERHAVEERAAQKASVFVSKSNSKTALTFSIGPTELPKIRFSREQMDEMIDLVTSDRAAARSRIESFWKSSGSKSDVVGSIVNDPVLFAKLVDAQLGYFDGLATERAEKQMKEEAEAQARLAAQKEARKKAEEEKAAKEAAAEKEKQEKDAERDAKKAAAEKVAKEKKAAAEKAAKERKAAQDERDRARAAQKQMKKAADAKTNRVLGDCERQCQFGDTPLQKVCLKQCGSR